MNVWSPHGRRTQAAWTSTASLPPLPSRRSLAAGGASNPRPSKLTWTSSGLVDQPDSVGPSRSARATQARIQRSASACERASPGQTFTGLHDRTPVTAHPTVCTWSNRVSRNAPPRWLSRHATQRKQGVRISGRPERPQSALRGVRVPSAVLRRTADTDTGRVPDRNGRQVPMMFGKHVHVAELVVSRLYVSRPMAFSGLRWPVRRRADRAAPAPRRARGAHR